MSQPLQQAPYDPEIIFIVNSPVFQAWYQYHSQYFPFASVYEAAVIFALEALPDVVSKLTGGLHPGMSSQFETLNVTLRSFPRIAKHDLSIHYRSF